MSYLNVTKDIKKLAQEAERTRSTPQPQVNPSNENNVLETSGAGLGLGSAYYADKMGAPKNPTNPTNLTAQANDAQLRANQANVANQVKANPNVTSNYTPPNKPPLQNPTSNKGPIFEKPKFTAEPKVDTRGKPPPKETLGKKLFNFAESGGDALKKGLKNTVKTAKYLASPKRLGPQIVHEAGTLLEDKFNYGEKFGGMFELTPERVEYFDRVAKDPDQRIGLHKFADTAYDTYEFTGQVMQDAFETVINTPKALYDYAMKSPSGEGLLADLASPATKAFNLDDYQKFYDGVSPSGAGIASRDNRPNPQMNQNISPVETPQVNQPQADPMQESTGMEQVDGNIPTVQKTQDNNQLDSATPENIPSYQATFLKRMEEGTPINEREFKKAQSFAVDRGLVFDPETGFEKADFSGQMFKGQTISQFLRGEDTPTNIGGNEFSFAETGDTIKDDRSVGFQNSNQRVPKKKEFKADLYSDDPKKNPFVDGVRTRYKDEIGRSRKIIESEDGSYRDAYIPSAITEIMLKAPGKRSDKEVRRLAQWASSDQGKGMGGLPAVETLIKGEQKMTPYQKASLARGERQDAESLRRYEETMRLNREKLEEDMRQHEEDRRRGAPEEELNMQYKRMQILNQQLSAYEKLRGKEPSEGKINTDTVTDFQNLTEALGFQYDLKTGTYLTPDGLFGFAPGKPIDEETFVKKLEPILSRTDFGKALISIEKDKSK